MRAFIVTSILAMTLAAPQVTNAQAGRWKASVAGGITAPMGEFGDRNKTGGNGTVTVGYSPYHSSHTWSFEMGWHQLEQITKPEDNLGKVHSNVLMFMGRYDKDLTPNLYVTGAFGMVRDEYRVRFSHVALTNTDSHAGIAAGGGLAIANRFFVEGRVVYSFSDPDATVFVPVTFGIRF